MFVDKSVIGLLILYANAVVYGKLDIDVILTGTDKAPQASALILKPFIQRLQPADPRPGAGELAIGIVPHHQSLFNAVRKDTIKIKGQKISIRIKHFVVERASSGAQSAAVNMHNDSAHALSDNLKYGPGKDSRPFRFLMSTPSHK